MFPDLPDRQNSPLQIVRETPKDRRATFYALTQATPAGATGCAVPFSVTVSDPDLKDTISSQWFIDRTANSAALVRNVQPTGDTSRVIESPTSLGNQLSTLLDGKEHVVEVFVTDSTFGDDPSTATRPQLGTYADGGVWSDPAYVEQYSWVVSVQVCQ